MKKILFCISAFMIGTLSINAQSFQLLGQRNFNLNNWLLPEPQFGYSDSNGNPYLFFNVFDNDNFKRIALIRFNTATNAWEDIIGPNFLLNFTPSASMGQGRANGSCTVVTRNGSNVSEPNVLYSLDTNSFLQIIGPNPVPTNITAPFHPDANLYVASDGTIYYSEAAFFGDQNAFKKWTGNQWVQLPSIVEPTQNDIKNISIVKTDNGEVFAAYSHTTTAPDNSVSRHKKVVKLKADETAWEVVYTTPFAIDFSVSGGDLYVKNNEVYLLQIGRTGQGFDTSYKLIRKDANGNWGQLGPDLEIGSEAFASLLKTNAGDVYIAPAEGADTNIYKLNIASNVWVPLQNDIADGGPVSGHNASLSEGSNGKIYNIFLSTINSFTGVVFDPANLGTTDVSVDNNIGIYPNPFTNSFNIKLAKNLRGNHTFEVVDISGRLVLKGDLSQSQSEVYTSSLTKGVYIVNVKDGSNKTIVSKKIIKK